MNRWGRWLGTGFLCVFSALMLFGCTGHEEYSSQQFLMDTVVDITLYAHREETAREGALAAFDEIKRIADLTDRFPEKGSRAYELSDVCKINGMAGIRPVKVSDDVLTMVELSQKYYDTTEGAFDITVGPLMDLWGFAGKPSVPGDLDIREKLALVGMNKVIVDRKEKTVFVSRKGMSLDLGGIAKGYAAEKAGEKLKEMGISQGIINAGGNVVVLGDKSNRDPWEIGVQDPRDSNKLIGVLALKDQAAVTSGDYQRYFEKGGRRYHHLLDPVTGKPARKLISVTVVCDSSTQGDILSTALFVLGPDRGMELAEKMGAEAVFVSNDKVISVTSGLKDKITVTPGEDYTYDPKG